MYFHRRTERAARCLGEIVLVVGRIMAYESWDHVS